MARKDDDTAPWLQVMRAITGLTEYENGSNPKIEGMAAFIGRKFPAQAAYASQYTDDSIAWCGVATDFCLAACTPEGISGPFGPTDTDRWMWAQSFASDPGFIHLDAPVPGAIVVMTRSGGGHVTMFEEWDDGMLRCRGGNQSNCVNVSSYDPDSVIAYVWPKGWPAPPVPPAERRELQKGDQGSDVMALQTSLGVPADGDFGSVTDAQVKAYQRACGLTPDGVVGDMTWEQVDALDARMADGSSGVSDDLADQIVALAKASSLNEFSWPDRGRSPPGYLAGMALTYATAVALLADGDSGVQEMAQADTGDEDTDALAWYSDAFEALDMDNSKDGVDTLRHLFVMLIGLGMRESSGNYSCGRDQSAGSSSQTSDTCEAGLFQTSWNIRSASDELPKLFDAYWDDPNGFLPTFAEGISPTASNLETVGSGEGAAYQWLAKFSPAFAVMTTAIGLRTRRNHWGPINREEVDLSVAADDLLKDVELLMGEAPEPTPEPEPGEVAEVNITTKGNVVVTVNGTVVEGARRGVRRQRR